MNATANGPIPLWSHDLIMPTGPDAWIATFADRNLLNPRLIGEYWARNDLHARRVGYQVRDEIAIVNISGFIAKKPSAFGIEADFVFSSDIAEALRELGDDAGVGGVVLSFGDVPGATVAGPSRIIDAINRLRATGKQVYSHVGVSCFGAAILAAARADQVYAAPLARLGYAGSAQLATGWMIREGTDDVWEPDENDSKLVQDINRSLIDSLCKMRPGVDRNVIEQNTFITSECAEAIGLIDDLLTLDATVERLQSHLEQDE